MSTRRKPIQQKFPVDPIGHLYGDRAVQAPFMVIACRSDQGEIQRTMIGGTVLAGMCTTETWERWRGTAILIPTRVDLPVRSQVGDTIDGMMCTWLTFDDDERPFWRKAWEAS